MYVSLCVLWYAGPRLHFLECFPSVGASLPGSLLSTGASSVCVRVCVCGFVSNSPALPMGLRKEAVLDLWGRVLRLKTSWLSSCTQSFV